MGSYLSLFNTTPDHWLVKIIPTTWNWTSLPDIMQGVVRYINDSLRAINSQLTLSRDNSNSSPTGFAYVLSGLTPAILRGVLAMAGYPDNMHIHWTTAFYTITSSYIAHNEGCTEIGPGASLRHGAVTLSLIRRGVCYRVAAEPPQFLMHLLIMHPIFSGPTDGSTNVYHMQDWINSNGIDATLTLRLDSDSLAAISALPSPTTADASMSIDWLQEFAKAGLEAKQMALAEAGKDRDVGICELANAAPIRIKE